MGLFKKKNGEATKFTKAFASKSGKPSTFSKVLNTVLTVVDFVPGVGEASMAVQAGSIAATKVATKAALKIAAKDAAKVAAKAAANVAAKDAVKEAVKSATKIALKKSLKTAGKSALDFGSKQAKAKVGEFVASKASQIFNGGSAPASVSDQGYDFQGPKASLGDAQERPIKVGHTGLLGWLESLFS